MLDVRSRVLIRRTKLGLVVKVEGHGGWVGGDYCVCGSSVVGGRLGGRVCVGVWQGGWVGADEDFDEDFETSLNTSGLLAFYVPGTMYHVVNLLGLVFFPMLNNFFY